MLVTHKASSDPDVVLAAPTWRSKLSFMAEHARIFAACGFEKKNIFKISIATDGAGIAGHPLVKSADVVALGWVNQGMMSLADIGKIASQKPVVWTMHDMWNITSLCHHAAHCLQWREGIQPSHCCECPLVKVKSLGRSTWRRKSELYKAGGITFVAVSSWLKSLSAESSLMEGQDVRYIANPFSVEDYSLTPTNSRASLGLPEDKKLIVMGAARLDDPIKGLPLAVEALNHVESNDAVAVFYGALKDPHALDELKFPHIWLGPLPAEKVRELYAHASVVMSTSHYESFGLTLVEGMAAGCTPVSFDRGGQSDIISTWTDGHLIQYADTAAFASALDDALAHPRNPESLRASVAARFSSPSIASQYTALFEELAPHSPAGGLSGAATRSAFFNF